jgi:hypothetical protein
MGIQVAIRVTNAMIASTDQEDIVVFVYSGNEKLTEEPSAKCDAVLKKQRDLHHSFITFKKAESVSEASTEPATMLLTGFA